MIAQRSYNVVPRVEAGYPLNPEKGWFSVIVPIARMNLVTNPSFETGTTNWAAISGGTLAQSATYQYYGTYSAIYTPTANTTDGIRYTGTLSLTSGTLYAYQIRFLGIGGHSYKLALTDASNTIVASVVFVATGSWQWVYGYYTPISTATHRVAVTKNNDAGVLPFYVDGVMVEALNAGETVSTYIDGDQLGIVPNQSPAPYLWLGTPHASASSRSGQTRAGGMIVNLQDTFRFFLTAIVGLGLNVPQHVVTDYVVLDGSQYQYTRKPSRQFSLIGQMNAIDGQQLRTNRGDMGTLLDRDLIGTEQPCVLRYQSYDCLRETSDEGEIVALYDGGLEGNDANHYAQDIPLHFTAYLPYVRRTGDSGSSTTVQLSVANADYFLARSPAGTWYKPGSVTAGAQVSVFARGLDGNIYIGGNFANWGGNANADNIVRYDPVAQTFSALSTGTNGNVVALAVRPDGKLYVGGQFALAAGVANTVKIALYDPVANTFSALGTGATGGDVLALAVAANGDLYAGGDFTQMGGVANTARIAKWNGSAWSALSTGANGAVRGLAVAPDGVTLYLTGGFTTLGGTSASQIGKWNGTAFSALSTGLNGAGGLTLVFGPTGQLYVGGFFTLAGGIANTSHIAVWNGVAFQPLSAGLDGDVYNISVAPDGTLTVCGKFTRSGTQALFSDSIARWNGASFVQIGADFPGTIGVNTINAVFTDRDGTIYVAYDVNGSAITEAITTITNAGTAATYPTVTIRGPSSGTSRIYQIVNTTTGKAIYLGYTINSGETATLVFQPDALSFTSDFQGNIANTILPGSDEANFFLQPGANTFSVFAASSTVTVTLRWRNTYASLDDLTR